MCILTNPQCQITQQSGIDILQTGKRFPIVIFKPKRERQEQCQNYFTSSRVISEKIRAELSGQYNDQCAFCHLIREPLSFFILT